MPLFSLNIYTIARDCLSFVKIKGYFKNFIENLLGDAGLKQFGQFQENRRSHPPPIALKLLQSQPDKMPVDNGPSEQKHQKAKLASVRSGQVHFYDIENINDRSSCGSS